MTATMSMRCLTSEITSAEILFSLGSVMVLLMDENPTNETNSYFKNVLRLCLLPISSYANVIAAKTESLTVSVEGDDKKTICLVERGG
jgi:hypothetical protein